MAGSFTVLSHTADTGIAVAADSLSELFEWAGRGMCAQMYDIDRATADRHVEIVVESSDVSELMVDTLAEILYLSEAYDLVPVSFIAHEASATRIRLAIGVAPVHPGVLVGAPIKAVTYHELAVRQLPDATWRARVLFDV